MDEICRFQITRKQSPHELISLFQTLSSQFDYRSDLDSNNHKVLKEAYCASKLGILLGADCIELLHGGTETAVDARL